MSSVVEFRSISQRKAKLAAARAPAPAPTAPRPSIFGDRMEPKPSPSFGELERFRLDLQTAGTPPKQKFLLDPIMPLGVAGLLFAPGGVGKSMLALDLCLAVAVRAMIPQGTWCHMVGPLGGSVPPEAGGASIFITLEDDVAEIHRRTLTLDPDGRRVGAPCFVIPGISLQDFDPALVAAEGKRAALTAFAKRGIDELIAGVAAASGYAVRLLVLDPAGAFIDADESDAQFVKPIMFQLGAVAARQGCTILLVGHVAKAMDGKSPSMFGSHAWVSNSRFAYGLWRPDMDEADKLGKKLGVPANSLVWGALTKANHRGAPTNMRRLYQRDAAGRLVDVTRQLGGASTASIEALVNMLAAACQSASDPFTLTGSAGLYQRRAELPGDLGALSRARLEAVGAAALASGKLARGNGQHGSSHLVMPEADPA